jgi:N-acetylglutamate synthase/N-acetylornithine aminotransferase
MAEAENILPVAGIKLASIAAGIKKNGNQDLVVLCIVVY